MNTKMINLPTPSTSGSLAEYIQNVNSIPLLTQEEELTLAEQKDLGDLEAAKKLILSHLRVVVSIARGYEGYGINQADLIQEGNIGLMKAVKRFEPSRGVRLFSYAVHWIKAEIHEFILRNWRLVRIATTKPQRKLFFNLRSMRKNMNALSDVEAQQIANDLGVKREEVFEMETRLTGTDIALVADDDKEDSFAPIDWLSDTENEPTRLIEKKNDETLQTEGLQLALMKLDDRSKDIIMSRWLADDKGATLHDMADKYGISAERVRQIEVKAMQKLKGFLTQEN